MYQLYTCNGVIVKNCRCWLSPVPMTDEEIEEFIKKGDTEKVKIQDKRKKKEKVSTVQTPTVTEIPKPTTLEEFKKAFDRLDQEKWNRINNYYEQEIKEQAKLKRLNKDNYKSLAELDKAKRNSADEKTLKALADKVKDNENKLKEQAKLLTKIVDDRAKVDQQILNEQRKLLFADKPSEHEISVQSSVNRLPMKTVRDGLEQFKNLIPKDLLSTRLIGIDSTFNDVLNYRAMGATRSWFNPNDNIVYLRDTVPTSVVIHELVHWLEDKNSSLNKLAVQFLDRRTQGESEVNLNTLFPNQGYGANETAKLDKFDIPYMGKSYTKNDGSRTTEILTMGIEGIWKDPRSFIYKDPDYFEFIMKDILGKIK